MIINKNEVILNAIPELKTLDNSNNKIEYVSYNNFESRMKRIEKQNLKKYGKTLSFSSLQGYFNLSVLEVDSSNQLYVINKKAYKLIRDFVTSENFVLQ